jgi:energy-coupling factor transporter ATP-binding protein EcfA2
MPHIVGVMGPLGAGKTTLASIMAWLWKNKVEARGGHVQLFSNYGLSGSVGMNDYSDWYKVATAQGSICVWDEAHRVIDARQALKSENILTSHVLTFARKMSSIQIFVTPAITNLDSRLRQLLEVLIVVSKVGNKGMRFQYYDYQAQNYGAMGKYLHSRFLPAGKVSAIHKLNLFDSHSMVGGFPLPKTEREQIKFMEELENQHDKARFLNVDISTGEILAI